MKILLLSKALVVGAYQKKCEELAKLPGIELTVAVPPSWKEPRVGTQLLERRFTTGYHLEVLPIAFNGRHHLHFYPTLGKLLKRVRPDVFHIDEESFNLATFLAMRAGVKVGARCCFYNYANIERFYPPPFAFFERYAFRHAAHALAANHEAAAIIRRHGYQGPLTIIPQFGVDPDLFSPVVPQDIEAPTQPPAVPTQPPAAPGPAPAAHTQQLMVGYIGRLVPEKGILDLVEAVALLPETVQLRIIGEGAQRAEIEGRIQQLGLEQRAEVLPWTQDMPGALRALDVLVLPSHTTATWKEQFGRILVEAMSCGLAVVGSSSGEIPQVLGDAGLIFPEGDSNVLSEILSSLSQQPDLRQELGRRGRARVLAHYTQAALARQYAEMYRTLAGQ